ncbi:MerR family transcriptional regulator [Amycolatopsis minnesotensis]|uniref:MerR family transcriptional regulator n=1 Tax=Amycolatopsis minnesotensis TaxID=337894 RepID=A0ABN2QE55_9PSEU
MSDGLLSISVFARRVGITPSALRFYADCGVLTPAKVDPVTGYRLYHPGQEDRAVLVRRLREAGLPLPKVTEVLDGAPEATGEILREHLRSVREAAESAALVVEEVLAERSSRATSATIGGAELAGAIRQVVPAVDSTHPTLAGVLVEVDTAEVRLIASDRYRLAMRSLTVSAMTGAPRRAVVGGDELAALGPEVARSATATLTVDDRYLSIRATAPVRLTPADVEYPDYRVVLAQLGEPVSRVVTGRERLRDAVLAGDSAKVLLGTGGDELVVGASRLPALCAGETVLTAFDPAVLAPALEAGVGPDALLEFTADPHQPVVVRSADQGDFRTLVMPVPR